MLNLHNNPSESDAINDLKAILAVAAPSQEISVEMRQRGAAVEELVL
jgi:hypothetical protein